MNQLTWYRIPLCEKITLKYATAEELKFQWEKKNSLNIKKAESIFMLHLPNKMNCYLLETEF